MMGIMGCGGGRLSWAAVIAAVVNLDVTLSCDDRLNRAGQPARDRFACGEIPVEEVDALGRWLQS